MYLYSNGCSMTYGSELCDDPVTHVSTDDRYRWTHSWPGRLYELLGTTGVFNDALPSGSNDRIVRTTMGFTGRWLAVGLPADALLVVVGWSHPARREFYVGGDYRQVVPHHHYDIRDLDRLVRAYRRSATSDDEAHWRYYTQVAGLAAFLRQHGVPYLFFNAIAAPPPPAALEETCVVAAARERFVGAGTPETTMVAALANVRHAIHVQHPSETGHQVWADTLSAALREHDVPLVGSVTADAVLARDLPIMGGTHAPHRHDRKPTERRRALAALRSVPGRRARAVARAASSDGFIYP